MKISIIIPVFNESEEIKEIIGKIKAKYPDYEIIIIDDGSTDGTGDVARNTGAMVFEHPYNIGNGAAIKTGIRKSKGDILIFMDGDGQHDPEDIEKLIRYIPKYDMVVGERTKRGQSSYLRYIANMIYNWMASYVTKRQIKDLTSGYRAVKTDIAKQFLYLLPNTYSYPTTITLSLLRSGYSIKYLPIKIKKRKSGFSKISAYKDSVRFVLIIIKICTFYSPMRVFLPVSAFFFLSGIGYYIYTYIIWHRFTNMSALLFTTSIMIFMMGLISEQIAQMQFERNFHPQNVKALKSLFKNE